MSVPTETGVTDATQQVYAEQPIDAKPEDVKAEEQQGELAVHHEQQAEQQGEQQLAAEQEVAAHEAGNPNPVDHEVAVTYIRKIREGAPWIYEPFVRILHLYKKACVDGAVPEELYQLVAACDTDSPLFAAEFAFFLPDWANMAVEGRRRQEETVRANMAEGRPRYHNVIVIQRPDGTSAPLALTAGQDSGAQYQLSDYGADASQQGMSTRSRGKTGQSPQPPQSAPSGGEGAGGQGNARNYLFRVKQTFGEASPQYLQFMAVMKAFREEKISTHGVIQRISELFVGHADLIEQFNTFLPPDHRVSVQSGRESGRGSRRPLRPNEPPKRGGAAMSHGGEESDEEEVDPECRELHVGGEGRAILKALISQKCRENPEVKAQVAAIGQIKFARLYDLLRMAKVCGLWKKAVELHHIHMSRSG